MVDLSRQTPYFRKPAASISARYTIGKSGPSVPARPSCGQDGTRPTVADPPATAVAVAAARALDARRADQLSAARRAPALTELHRSDLVAAPQLERRRRGMQKTQKWHSQVWCECHFCVGFFTAAAAQPAEWPQRHGACRLPRKGCQMRWSCARVGVEVSKAAGMMPEHSPVPPEACRGPRVDDQRRTVPMLC